MGYRMKLPSSIYSGTGSIEDIKNIVKQEAAKKILVFTDKGVAGAGLLDKLLKVLNEAGVSYTIFDDLKPEPAYQDVEKVVKQMEQENGDLIVAIGSPPLREKPPPGWTGARYYRRRPRLAAFAFSSASFFFSLSARTSMEAMTKARSLMGKSRNLDGSQPNFCRQKWAKLASGSPPKISFLPHPPNQHHS